MRMPHLSRNFEEPSGILWPWSKDKCVWLGEINSYQTSAYFLFLLHHNKAPKCFAFNNVSYDYLFSKFTSPFLLLYCEYANMHKIIFLCIMNSNNSKGSLQKSVKMVTKIGYWKSNVTKVINFSKTCWICLGAAYCGLNG